MIKNANLDQAKQLCEEAYQLSMTLSNEYLSKAIPMARQNIFSGGSDEVNRLHRILDKAHERLRRRKEYRDDLIWPRRVEIRAKLAA